MERQPHGIPGQVNIYTLDVDSDITSHGKHNRLLVFGDQKGRFITIREDVRGLPMSTEAQRLKIANGWQRQHPKRSKLIAIESRSWTNNNGAESIEHEYRIEK